MKDLPTATIILGLRVSEWFPANPYLRWRWVYPSDPKGGGR